MFVLDKFGKGQINYINEVVLPIRNKSCNFLGIFYYSISDNLVSN